MTAVEDRPGGTPQRRVGLTVVRGITKQVALESIRLADPALVAECLWENGYTTDEIDFDDAVERVMPMLQKVGVTLA